MMLNLIKYIDSCYEQEERRNCFEGSQQKEISYFETDLSFFLRGGWKVEPLDIKKILKFENKLNLARNIV